MQLKEIGDALLGLVFPHICENCGSDLLSKTNLLCGNCLARLPDTDFHFHASNPIEKIFWGRMPVSSAASHYYYTRSSIVQGLMQQIKYKGNRELAGYLGLLTGEWLRGSIRFNNIDALVPLPLHPERERKRGYNQAELLCRGMSGAMNLPVITGAVARLKSTETQTKKGRIERWTGMEGRFGVIDESSLKNRHLLLVDDVITTGATLEACGKELLSVEGVRLSVATLCYASR